MISIVLDQARAGDALTVEGDGTQTRDFIHVEDIVEAKILAATTNEASGEVFNIGTSDSISITELATKIRDTTNLNSDIVHVDSREGDIKHSETDIRKARDVLGSELVYHITEGIEAYLG